MPSKELQELLSHLHGENKGLSIGLGSEPDYRPRKLPVNIDALDAILGGGLPFGRTVLLKGDFSSGKTFLAQKIIQAAQLQNMLCAYIDVERAFEPTWFGVTGVDVDNLLVSQPASGEDAFDLAVALVKAGTHVVVMDSVAALISASEIEEGMDQGFIGVQARLLGKGMRKVTRENKNKTIFVLINQLRMGIGPMPFPTDALPGGKANWFYPSIILDVRRGPWIEDGVGTAKKRVGFNMRIRTDKNKMSPPQQTCELPFLFEGGVLDTTRGVFDLAVDMGVITQRGAMYESELFAAPIRGKLNVLKLLNSDAELVKKVQELVRGHVGGGANEPPAAS